LKRKDSSWLLPTKKCKRKRLKKLDRKKSKLRRCLLKSPNPTKEQFLLKNKELLKLKKKNKKSLNTTLLNPEKKLNKQQSSKESKKKKRKKYKD